MERVNYLPKDPQQIRDKVKMPGQEAPQSVSCPNPGPAIDVPDQGWVVGWALSGTIPGLLVQQVK